MCVMYLLPYLAIQLIGAGVSLESLTGGLIPYWVGALLFAIVMVIYVILEGMRSVAWTDFIQGVVMYFALVISALVVAQVLGGLGNIVHYIEQNFPELLSLPGPAGYYKYPVLWGYILAFFLGAGLAPHMLVRYYAAKSKKVLGQTAIAFSLLFLIIFWFQWILGWAGRVAFGAEITSPDAVVPMLLAKYAPILGVIIVVGVFAAGMSTLDSQPFSPWFTSSKRHLRKHKEKASERELIHVSIITMLILLLLAFILAIKARAMIVPLATYSLQGTMQLAPAYILGLYWRRATKTAALISILTSAIVYGVLQFIFKNPWAYLYGLIVGFVLMIVISLVTPEVSEETLRKFDVYRKGGEV